jgi:hypothetical protein
MWKSSLLLKIFLVVLISTFLVFSVTSCQDPGSDGDNGSEKAWVRFQNNTDYILFYGVKYGDAEYIGEVPPGFLSDYMQTDPGTYSLQARTAGGGWVTISAGSLTCYGGHHYTIVGTGSGGVYYWNLVQDS